jgi:hypothetical protein
MFAMAGLGLVDLVDEDTYEANAVTKYMLEVPSSIHGMLHLSVILPGLNLSAIDTTTVPPSHYLLRHF